MPKISVCSSAYNHEKYVSEAICSVLAQTCSDFELLITDDYSRDRTVEIIRQFKDDRIKLFTHISNRGNMAASGTSFEHSSGSYITWLNTDDMFEPEAFAILASYLDEHPEVAAVFGRAALINDDGEPLGVESSAEGVGLTRYQHLRNLFKVNNYFRYPAVMIRRSVFDSLGYFPRHLRQIHDLAYWIRILFHAEVTILPDLLIRFRIRNHDANAGSDIPENRRRINFEVFENLRLFVDHIKTTEVLRAIFPEVDDHPWPLSERLIPFHIAQIAIAQPTAHHRLFGLHVLYGLMSDPETAEYICTTCNFDYPDLYRLEGEKSLFADYDELNKSEADLRREVKLFRQMYADQNDHATNLSAAYEQLLQSRSWKLARIFTSVGAWIASR
jgi:glycosyltransferase involved in cell wall biosynthesis